jgi:polysaccharide export outer membrane protein
MRVFERDVLRSLQRPLLAAAALCLIALSSACTTRKANVPYNVADFGAPDIQTVELPDVRRTVAPLDKLTVKVFQVEELSGDYQVDSNGRIAFPLIGEVTALGKTPQELSAHIASQLGRKYLKSPNVQVAIVESIEQTITVDGSVTEPGVLPIKGSVTLMRAIAMAKGLKEDANPARVYVFRRINGQKMAAGFDLSAIRRNEAPDPDLYGNDIVVVDGSRTRGLLKEVISFVPILAVFRPY